MAKHGPRHQRDLARYQRRMTPQRKDGRRDKCTKRRIARIHERIADSRAEARHKFATDRLKRSDGLYLEDLTVRGITATKMRRATPRRSGKP